ncbi:hypothetical protein BDQ12DRAFT_725363 [Crucibulum laeve]|uniref:Uncharacterized protein n=1 Tax=Crucibulum laeve TaxID=68775 RepID=A0A5C3LSG0_9AGAR|nr:hypothetical protein BDQ12DRAFT_725363 [Crucibulum laeve]
MASFHLRPVSDTSPSPSPTASTTPPGDHSPAFKGPSSLHHHSPPPSTSTSGRSRRPLSPSSLRDVDLSHNSDMPPRSYPPPPTGHDLMAMFPPPPPDIFPEMRGGPTSGYFQKQERAFFAQAGKEIVRVRVELDLPPGAEAESSKSRAREAGTSRPWPPSGHTPSGAGSAHHSPVQSSSSAPMLYPHPTSRPSHRGPVPVTTAPLFPIASHPPSSQLPPNLHPPPTLHQPSSGIRTPPQESTQSGAPSAKAEFQTEEYDPDEAWRRPMPYAERRRAGKHTRRVIVRT